MTLASEIGYVPGGNISATNVQAAIEELDAEKIATAQIGAADGVAGLDENQLLFPSVIPIKTLRHVNPEQFGDWDTNGATDNLATLVAAQAAAVANGLYIDGGGKTLGIVGADDTGWGPLGGSLKLRDITLKDLKTGTRHASRRLVNLSGADKAYLERVKFDKNGNGVGGHVSNAGSAYFTDIDEFVAAYCDFTGNDKGVGLYVWDSPNPRVLFNRFYGLKYLHDGHTDDQVGGLGFTNCPGFLAFGNTIERLGRIDQEHVERDRYSRGIGVSGSSSGGRIIANFIRRCDQGIDISGSIGTRDVIIAENILEDIATYAIKGANTARGMVVADNSVRNVGRAAVAITGSSGTECPNQTGDVLVSNNRISGVGWNQIWSAISPRGVELIAGTGGTAAERHPRGVYCRGNLITGEKGASTFTMADTDEINLATPLHWVTGQRVRLTTTGSLSGLATATNYYVIPLDGTFSGGQPGGRVKLANSFINAQDGLAIAGIGAGTGTHTITQQSDLQCGATGNAVPYVDAPNIWASDNIIRGEVQVSVVDFHSWRAVATGTHATATGNTIGLQPNTLVEDGIGMIAVSSGDFTAKVAGKHRMLIDASFASNATGHRTLTPGYAAAGGSYTDDAYATLTLAGVTGAPTYMRVTLERYLEVGGKMRCRAVQDSGGNLDVFFRVTFERLES